MLRILILLSVVMLNGIAASACDKHKSQNIVANISRQQVVIPQAVKKRLGIENPGVGSGLTFKKKDTNGDLLFYSITDRGINLTNGLSRTGQEVVVFGHPNFQPFVSEIKLTKGKEAVVVSTKEFGFTGRPPKLEKEVLPVSTTLDVFDFDEHGLDSEAIDIDKDGNFWIADEYRPAIIKYSPSGEKLEQVDAANFLPEILLAKSSNRGIESLAITPSGKIIFAIESVLNIDSKTRQTAEFIRIVQYDPVTKKTRMFAYQFDEDKYKNNGVIKIGDLAAIDENNFLLVEQGPSNTGDFINDIYVVNIEKATDISHIKHEDGNHLEFAAIEGVIELPVEKRKLLSMREHGWVFEKLEGIAYVDEKTFAIINDNDFGSDPEIQGVRGAFIADYAIDLENRTLTKDGKTEKPNIKLFDNKAETEIWLVELTDPILCK